MTAIPIKAGLGAMAAAMLAACAGQTPAPPLRLHGEQAEAEKIDAAFAAEIAQRYRRPTELNALKTDLTAQSFQCQDVPPVEARGDYLRATCTQARPHGVCTDTWRIDLRYAPDAGGAFVRAAGAFHRLCVRE